MKQIFLYFISFIITITSFITDASESSILQHKIILSNTRGIPFSIGDGDYAIWGFEVDDDENFWFLGGDFATLVKMTKKGEVLLRREYSEFKANPIGIREQNLYVFDYVFDRGINRDPHGKLFVISCDNGKILKDFPILFKNRLNWHGFLDNGIIFELSFAKPPYDIKDMFKYFLYSYDGKYIGEVSNESGLNEPYNFLKFDYYIGKYKNNPLFAKYCMENDQWEIFTIDIRGQITQKTIIDHKILGEPFSEAPKDLWCLSNNKLFMVYRKGESAIITELDLNKLMK
ncbi:MAG: hypothetical protein GX654_09055 [Desulfatiglans sp.]|jgi:hypothetical protein|nr:hypothetical protein [Desulfatiglans sp.]